MAIDPDWEYHYRWPTIINEGILNSVDKLEARDRSLEQYLLGFGLDRDCSVVFEFPFRWEQIVHSPLEAQITMLSERDNALENVVSTSPGNCALNIPFKWSQIWAGLVNAEPWAIACAEENDRAIEDRFKYCDCGGA